MGSLCYLAPSPHHAEESLHMPILEGMAVWRHTYKCPHCYHIPEYKIERALYIYDEDQIKSIKCLSCRETIIKLRIGTTATGYFANAIVEDEHLELFETNELVQVYRADIYRRINGQFSYRYSISSPEGMYLCGDRNQEYHAILDTQPIRRRGQRNFSFESRSTPYQETMYSDDMEGHTIESMEGRSFNDWMKNVDELIKEIQREEDSDF